MKTHAALLLKGIFSLQFLLITINDWAQDKTEQMPAPSQNATSGIGVRFGSDLGMSYKHYFKTDAAWEAIVSSGYKAFDFTMLYERQVNIFKTPGLNFFYGAGAHAGFFQRRLSVHYDPYYYYYYSYNAYPSLGVDGILGVEYKIPALPLSVGLDMKPVIDFYYPGYSFLDGALTIRYVFHGPG